MTEQTETEATISYLENKLALMERQNEALRNARDVLLEQNKRLKQTIAKMSGQRQENLF